MKIAINARMDLGVIGGTAVSHIRGNLVDLETDLRGTTRKASLCPSQKFTSVCDVVIWLIANQEILNCR